MFILEWFRLYIYAVVEGYSELFEESEFETVNNRVWAANTVEKEIKTQ